MSRLRNRNEKKIEKNIVSWCIERLNLPVAPQSLYEGKTHLRQKIGKGYSLWLTDLPFRGKPLPLIRTYNRRWSIENAFQEEERFQAKTKSPDIRLRFSMIFLSAVLRNLWLLLEGGCDEFTSFLIREVMYIVALSYLKGEKRLDRFSTRSRLAGG